MGLSFGGAGGPIAFRYAGHVPPAEGEWAGERADLGQEPADECARWFSKSYGYSNQGAFSSPEECRALQVAQTRLARVGLPRGLAPFPYSTPMAVDAAGVWFLAQRTRAVDGLTGHYALLHLTPDRRWTIVDWPFRGAEPWVLFDDPARGGLWVGGPDGLIFSDGQTVQRMPLIPAEQVPLGPPVVDLRRDRAGRLWAGTEGGLLRFDPAAGDWMPTEVLHPVMLAPDDAGGLWAVGLSPDSPVSHFDGGRWVHHPKPPAWSCWPRDVAADVGGGLWLTSPACELQGFDGQNWAPYPVNGELQAGVDFRGALLARAPDGALYLGAQDQILRYVAGEWQALPAPDSSDVMPLGVSALVADEQGGMWVGSWSAPYLRYFDGARWHDFGDAVDVPVHRLMLDDAGRLWVGAEGGLMGYDGTTWQRVESGDMLVALAQGPKGRIWASGPRGLYVYTPD